MKAKQILLYGFCAVEAVLFCLIMASVNYSYILSYVSIALCLGFSLTQYQKSADWVTVVIALAFTLVADTFLVLLKGQHKVIAMLAFNITQITYAVKICLKSNKVANIISLSLRAGVIFVAELVAFVILHIKFDALIFVTLIYFANLLFNAIFAFVQGERNYIFAVGLILFILCDINVGLPYLTGLFEISQTSLLYKYLHIHFNFIWFFYLPSQVLIALSLYFKHRQKTQKPQ